MDILKELEETFYVCLKIQHLPLIDGDSTYHISRDSKISAVRTRRRDQTRLVLEELLIQAERPFLAMGYNVMKNTEPITTDMQAVYELSAAKRLCIYNLINALHNFNHPHISTQGLNKMKNQFFIPEPVLLNPVLTHDLKQQLVDWLLGVVNTKLQNTRVQLVSRHSVLLSDLFYFELVDVFVNLEVLVNENGPDLRDENGHRLEPLVLEQATPPTKESNAAGPIPKRSNTTYELRVVDIDTHESRFGDSQSDTPIV
jgi:hypothetical protein